MHQNRACGRRIVACTCIFTIVSTVLTSARDAAGQSSVAAELGWYLHYKTGMHDYLYGPGGVAPRYLGLPAQAPTYGELPSTKRVIIIHRAKCDALNIQVTVPSTAWKKVDPREVGSRSSFLLTRENPDITISLAGERVGVEAQETNRTLMAASK